MESNLKFKEHKFHEALYNNILLLTRYYPTSKEFKEVFQKEMFLKNNKAAFQQVVYYLLHTLNPQMTKEKISCWPPFDIRRENKFRTEILNYVNELGAIYENADIPHIMASQLISPGGYKFIVFMFKLSVLVMREHLRESGLKNEILFPIKPNRNHERTEKLLGNLRKKTSKLLGETMLIIEDFELVYRQSKAEAKKVMEEINHLNEKARKNGTSAEICASSTEIAEKLTELTSKVENLKPMGDVSQNINGLLSFMGNKDLVLEHDRSDLKLPKSVEHLVKDKDTLDLIELFGALKVFLEHGNLEVPNFTCSYLDRTTVSFEELIAKYERVNKQLDERKFELEQIIAECQEKFNEKVTTLPQKTSPFLGDEDLAVPLEESSNS